MRRRARRAALFAPFPQKRSLFSWIGRARGAPPNTFLPFSTTSLFFPIHIPSLLDLFLPWIPCTTSPFSALLPCPSLALLPHTSLAFSSHALFLRGSPTHTHPLLPNTHIPCLSPTHFLSLHSRLTRSSSLCALPPLASQHTHPLPFSHIVTGPSQRGVVRHEWSYDTTLSYESLATRRLVPFCGPTSRRPSNRAARLEQVSRPAFSHGSP